MALGFVADIIDCYHGKASKCFLVGAEILIPEGIGVIVRAVVGLRIAMRTGSGLVAALRALEASGIEASALTKLEEAALKAASVCSRTGFAAIRPAVSLGGGAVSAIDDHPSRNPVTGDYIGAARPTVDGRQPAAASTNTASANVVAYTVTTDQHTNYLPAGNTQVMVRAACENVFGPGKPGPLPNAT